MNARSSKFVVFIESLMGRVVTINSGVRVNLNELVENLLEGFSK